MFESFAHKTESNVLHNNKKPPKANQPTNQPTPQTSMLYLVTQFTDAVPQIIFTFSFQLIHLIQLIKHIDSKKAQEYKSLLKLQINSLLNEDVLEMPKEYQGGEKVNSY